jgi:hypothetical protein
MSKKKKILEKPIINYLVGNPFHPVGVIRFYLCGGWQTIYNTFQNLDEKVFEGIKRKVQENVVRHSAQTWPYCEINNPDQAKVMVSLIDSSKDCMILNMWVEATYGSRVDTWVETFVMKTKLSEVSDEK